MTNTNIIRKVTIKTNNQWTETIELSRIEGKPESFQKRVVWDYGLNKNFKETTSELDVCFLEHELKHIESNVRHYGNRVLENI